MIAHRGVSGLEKENTNAAFVAAGNRSYWGVETDVHVTADGEVIVIHDDDTLRVTGEMRVVEETDFATLRAMPLLDRDGVSTRVDLRMPSLEEYLRICKRYDKTCVLELKRRMTPQQIAMILARIEAEGMRERVILISFSFENLVDVRRIDPEWRVQFLFSSFSEEILAAMQEYRMDVDIHHKALTEELLARFHAAGMEVNCWTVDDPQRAEEMVGWGVDYITSNILE